MNPTHSRMMDLEKERLAAARQYRVEGRSRNDKTHLFDDANKAVDFAQRSARRAREYREVWMVDGAGKTLRGQLAVVDPSGQVDLTFQGSPLIRCQKARPDDFLSLMS